MKCAADWYPRTGASLSGKQFSKISCKLIAQPRQTSLEFALKKV